MADKLGEYEQTVSQHTRDELITEHLWLVRHLAGRMIAQLPPGVDADNLESAGVLGLVEAASRFDLERGSSFKSYAGIRIRGAMLDELRRNCPLPQELLQQVAIVHKAQQILEPPIKLDDLVEATGLARERIVDCLAAIPLTQMHSIEQMGNVGFSSPPESPDSGLQYEDQKRVLADAIASLPKRERLVVTLYYMQDLRLKEIGHVLKLSESRVSRLLTGAQFQLRQLVLARFA